MGRADCRNDFSNRFWNVSERGDTKTPKTKPEFCTICRKTKNDKKLLLKDYQYGILMGAEKKQYFMRKLRGKSPFVENCLQENIR